MTGETGVSWSNSVVSAAQLANAGNTGCSGKGVGVIPDHDKAFAIIETPTPQTIYRLFLPSSTQRTPPPELSTPI